MSGLLGESTPVQLESDAIQFDDDIAIEKPMLWMFLMTLRTLESFRRSCVVVVSAFTLPRTSSGGGTDGYNLDIGACAICICGPWFGSAWARLKRNHIDVNDVRR